MPLPDYGVLVGTLNRFTRDDPNDFGSWYHGKMYLQTPQGEYECVIDVSTTSGIPVQYREVRNLDRAQFVLFDLENGWHRLARTPDSGALDYVRSPLLRRRRGVISVVRPLIEAINVVARSPQLGWVESTADNALDLLERRLSDCKRVFAFGAPYTEGKGVHDIHMNQGDPPDSPFQPLDGIWQDGGTIIESAGGKLDAFLTKFKPQSLETDDNGLPI